VVELDANRQVSSGTADGDGGVCGCKAGHVGWVASQDNAAALFDDSGYAHSASRTASHELILARRCDNRP